MLGAWDKVRLPVLSVLICRQSENRSSRYEIQHWRHGTAERGGAKKTALHCTQLLDRPPLCAYNKYNKNKKQRNTIKTKKPRTWERSRCRTGRGKQGLCKYRAAKSTPKLKLWKAKKKPKTPRNGEHNRCRIGRGNGAVCKRREAQTTTRLNLWESKKRKVKKNHGFGSTAGANSEEASEVSVSIEKLKLQRS